MRVAIVTSYNSKRPAGLERVLIEQLRGLDKLNKKQGVEYFVYTRAGADLEEVLKREQINSLPVVEVSGGKFWKELGLFLAPRADVYFFNGPQVPLFFCPKNYYVLIYDFAYKYFFVGSLKEKIKNILTDRITALALHRAKKVVAISNATRDEIHKFFTVDKSKITTIYLGWTAINNLEPEIFENLPDSYFMFIGTLKERKNVHRLIEAYALFKKQKTCSTKLVIVGKKDGSPYVKKLESVIAENNLDREVIFTGHVNDNQVAYIYKHARALVFPSQLEGFGMPPLEAMSFGVPVITSSTTSLGEVAGEAAILVDPTNVEAIARAMIELENNQKLRVDLIDKGKERIEMFSWDKSALAYNDLFLAN